MNHVDPKLAPVPRRPLFALAILTAIMLVVLFTLQIPIVWVPWIVIASTGMAVAGRILNQRVVVRAAVSTILATTTYAQCTFQPPADVPSEPLRARVAGRVLESRSSTHGSWYVIDATPGILTGPEASVDAVGLPATACTVIVQQSGQNCHKPLQPGSIIVATGLLDRGRPDDDGWLRSRSATFFLRIYRPGHGIWMQRTAPVWQEWLEVPRRWVERRLHSFHDTAAVSLLMGMLLGERSLVAPADRQAITVTGTSHVMSVSGLHVGVVTSILLAMVGAGGALQRWWQWWILIVIITSYVIITGGSPPAVRAAIMASLAGIGMLRQATVDGLNLLGASCLLEWWFWPSMTVTPSFILSSVVTMALLWGVSSWRTSLSGPRSLRTAVGVTLSATAGSALPVAIMMNRVAPLSPIANLLVVPLFTAAMTMSIGTILLSTVWWAGAWIIAWPVEQLLRLAMMIVRWIAVLSPEVRTPWLVATALVVACWWPVRRIPGQQRRARFWRAVLSLALVVASVGSTMPRAVDAVGVRVEESRQLLWVECVALTPLGTEYRSFTIGRRYGRPFVRLPNEQRHPSPYGRY